jgi:hypothetical protein
MNIVSTYVNVTTYPSYTTIISNKKCLFTWLHRVARRMDTFPFPELRKKWILGRQFAAPVIKGMNSFKAVSMYC